MVARTAGDAELHSQALAVWVQKSFIYGLGTDHHALHTAFRLTHPASTAPVNRQPRAADAVTCLWGGQLEHARTKLAEVLQSCYDRGDEADAVWVSQFCAITELQMGFFENATRISNDAVRRAERLGVPTSAIEALAVKATVAAYCGHEQDARRAAGVAIDSAREHELDFLVIAPTATLGFLETSLGNYEAALHALQPLLERFDPVHGTEIMVGGYLPDAIEALVTVGRHDEAEPLIQALQVNGTVRDRPWMQASGARGRAMLLAARGDLDAAQGAAEQAMKYHSQLLMPFERARTQVVLGQIQHRRRRRAAAAQTLTEAIRAFDMLGAPLWASRAEEQLGEIHEFPITSAGLTPTQWRIAERAAAGLSNRDIAEELFLSAKTVEMHLSRTYRKLGIRSRAQLHAKLGEHPPATPRSPAD